MYPHTHTVQMDPGPHAEFPFRMIFWWIRHGKKVILIGTMTVCGLAGLRLSEHLTIHYMVHINHLDLTKCL